jgi:hypothetical protein
MDRQIVYPGAIPLETDILSGERNGMVAIGGLASALFGSTTTANGLACTPTSPASMRVQVGPGEIYARENVDDTPFSSLPADTAHQIVKQGVMLAPALLSCPAPTTVGQSISYLVQAAFQEVDADAVTLPYYNASDPTQAYSGPANSGVAQPTARLGTVIVSVKPGVAGTTGTQAVPPVDAGFIPLWGVTVAYGATSISTGAIAAVAGASVVPVGGIVAAIKNLPALVQSGSLIYGVASGSANALAVALSPAPASLQAGLEVIVKATASNTGAATLSLNGGGAAAITYDAKPLPAGMLEAGQLYGLVYDGAAWQLKTPSFHGIIAYQQGSTGYRVYSNGDIDQWGNGSCGSDGSYTVTFPVPFATCDWAIASNNGSGPPTGFHATQILSATQMKVWASASAGVAAGAGTASYWEARGHV